MIRKLMASSAIVALMTAGAISVAPAQTQPTQAQDPAAAQQPAAGADAAAPAAAPEAPPKPIAQEGPNLTPDEPTIATAFIGRDVYSSEGEDSDNIGSVNDLIIGSDGQITHAVVGVGGFLGIGEKDVSVPFDQLQVVQEEDGDVRLIYAATREQLEAAEAFDRTAFDPEERVEEQQEAAAGADATAPAAGADTTAPAAAGAAAGGAAGAAAGAAATAGATADTAATTPGAAPAGTTGNQAAPAAADAPAPAGQQMAAAPATPAAPADQANAVPSEAGFVNFSADQIRATDIIGQELYGADNESIGEVADLVLQPEGNTRAAIIDVGGFLGIGEKRVAIPFDQIEMTQEQPPAADMTAQAPAGQTAPAGQAAPAAPAGQAAAPADPNAPAQTATGQAAAPAAQDAEPRLMVNMTREQLEQLPEWQDTTEQAAADQTTGAATGQAPAAGAADPNAPAGQNMAATDPNAPAAGTAGGQPAGAAAGDAQYATATQDLSADDLMGATVYSQAEESLGDVGDVIFDQSGQIQAVVIDVGGFLGIGEKPVAVQYDALNVQKGTDGDVRLMVNATQEQLEAAPSYEETAAAGAAGGQGQPAPAQ